MVLVAAMTTPATAVTTVTCSYTVQNWWSGGFAANIDITNHGPAINGWTVRWTFSIPTTDIQGWSAIISESGTFEVSAANMSWDAVIPAGKVTSFGWTALARSPTVPTDLTINGTPC
jgi:cellulase/cellobiase CelA1